MPGNEFGERTHNFFGQEGLSQDKHQSQVVEESWSRFGNGLVSNQKHIDPSLNANLKSYSTQQSVDPQRGHPSTSQHGLNFAQQPTRSEYSRSLLQEDQQPTNGYVNGNLMLQALPNEANFLGMNAESSTDRLSGRGFTPDLQKIPMRFEMRASPVNYDFSGGQQQLNSQLPGMIQPLPRQQMTFDDMQLLKQQVMVKQMHEYQMQQQQLQKQQLEAGQLNSLNSNGSRLSDKQSHPFISGIPLQDVSSNCWPPDLMTGNINWMQRAISPVVQGSSSGLIITPEHGQANLIAQQFEPSLYGMPVGGANAPHNAFSSVQMNRLAAQHCSANTSSSLTNQPTAFLNQGNVQDNHMLPRSTYQEKQSFSHTSVLDPNDRPIFESVQQDDSRERNLSVQEKFGPMEGFGLSKKSFMEVPENKTALQHSKTLDPTEEKILFGSDDNLWDAFGNSTDMSLTGSLMSGSSDLYDACPPLQCGSWSALMQSAVAETSSDDAGVHVWPNINTGPHANSQIGNRAHSDSTQTAVHHLQDRGNKVSDHGLLEKSMAHSEIVGNMVHSSSSIFDGENKSCSIQMNERSDDIPGIWKAASSPNVAALMEQKNHFTQHLQMQRASYDTGNYSSASRDAQGNIQQHLDNNPVENAGCPILESYASDVMVESNEMGNPGKENSSHSFRSKFSPESFTGFKEITQVSAGNLFMLPGGEETQSLSRSDGFHGDGLNHAASADADLQQKSSSYSQYGAFNNGLVQPVNDTGIFAPLKEGEQYSSVGDSVDGSHSVQSSKQLNIVDPSYGHIQQMSGSTPGAETPSSESLLHGATDKPPKVDKPKKRKAATPGLISWNKEVVQGPHKLKTLGEAELEWAKTTDRFPEKVEFESFVEDAPPVKLKRRLVYATQLIQQLFSPPSPRVCSNYEFVAYIASRAALGDACSSSSADRIDTNNSNPLCERTKTGKSSDYYISEATKDFKNRLQKLESDFAGLEKGSTITDLRIEVQDLERYAVINRFASFHQSSSSTDQTKSSLRLNPKRYVTIAPMPRNIPDRVQCLSF